jgi:hypothetical protein
LSNSKVVNAWREKSQNHEQSVNKYRFPEHGGDYSAF